MSSSFKDRIRTALADEQLQSALDGNAERRQKAFTQAFESLPEGRQAARRRAHAIRSQVITDLDHYLEQFITQAAENGLIVHCAEDGAQAIEIVRQIARDSGARLIAKSKTMVGEEIHLNRHLEADGLQVIETDLGEYIIQLRGEPPAHIITPAVHLTRAQVARTFEEKIGLPYTTDIPALTAAARRVLRQTFLEADIGISGVNFGVAESGTLCLVTNEGNGRMCTTLPQIHIALMGLERLVPTLQDLALMLSLLPRSATGQKLSVYTSLIHGPRRAGESDGPRQRHLILLDNGRSKLRQSPLAEALLCIRCGACLNACPVFREIGGHAYVGVDGQATPYPGPIGSVISPGLFGVGDFGNLARASSLCGACKEACPVDIDLPRLLLRVRSAGAQLPGRSPNAGKNPSRRTLVPLGLRLSLRLFSWIAPVPALYTLSQRLAGVFSRLVPAPNGWMRLPAFSGWGYSRDFPRPALRPFSASEFARQLQVAPAHVDEPFLPTSTTSEKTAPAIENVARDAKTDLVERFAAELAELGGAARRCSLEELPALILNTLQEHGVSALQTWDESFFPEGLLDKLRQAGLKLVQETDPSVPAGLTGALAGIAETGSLLILGGPGQPLTASLLPELHLAVLHASDLFERLEQALNLPEVRQASSAVLITGPSRTADIEMTLTIGVHGPRLLIVFLVEAAGSRIMGEP